MRGPHSARLKLVSKLSEVQFASFDQLFRYKMIITTWNNHFQLFVGTPFHRKENAGGHLTWRLKPDSPSVSLIKILFGPSLKHRLTVDNEGYLGSLHRIEWIVYSLLQGFGNRNLFWSQSKFTNHKPVYMLSEATCKRPYLSSWESSYYKIWNTSIVSEYDPTLKINKQLQISTNNGTNHKWS